MSVEEVERAMRGDHDAFAALIGASANRIYALASLILRDSDRAQDATQEAIVRAWRELAAPARPGAVRGVAAPDGRQRLL